MPAAAFRPDRVSIFSAIVCIVRYAKFVVCDATKVTFTYVLLVQLLVYGCHQTFPRVCEGLACKATTSPGVCARVCWGVLGGGWGIVVAQSDMFWLNLNAWPKP